jgi:peptidoglycan/xylan/chitin deacetylase (PgdA/CDA1 family)
MTNEKLVAFTFDDGPVEYAEDSSAMRILKTLEKYGQTATFFYVGQQMNADTKKEIDFAQSIGCEAGNHTYTHAFLSKCTKEEIEEEFEKTTKLLEEFTGKTPVLARIPYMEASDLIHETAGFPLAHCNVDSKDYTQIPAEEIIKNIMDAEADNELENAIVLLHEHYVATAEAVEYLIPTLMEKGYRFVTVSELAKRHNVTLEKGMLYSKLD